MYKSNLQTLVIKNNRQDHLSQQTTQVYCNSGLCQETNGWCVCTLPFLFCTQTLSKVCIHNYQHGNFFQETKGETSDCFCVSKDHFSGIQVVTLTLQFNISNVLSSQNSSQCDFIMCTRKISHQITVIWQEGQCLVLYCISY